MKPRSNITCEGTQPKGFTKSIIMVYNIDIDTKTSVTLFPQPLDHNIMVPYTLFYGIDRSNCFILLINNVQNNKNKNNTMQTIVSALSVIISNITTIIIHPGAKPEVITSFGV